MITRKLFDAIKESEVKEWMIQKSMGLSPEREELLKIGRGTVTDRDHRVLMWSLEKAFNHYSLSGQTDKPSIVEIGTHHADTAIAVVRALLTLGNPARFFTIDINFLNTNTKGLKGFYAKNEWARKKKGLPPLGDIEASFLEKRAVEASNDIADPLLWVFMDGCHCEECVVGELAAYAHRVIPGGFLVIHDCAEEYRGYPPDQAYHDITGTKTGKELRSFYVIEIVEKNEYLNDNYDVVAINRPNVRPEHNNFYGGLYCLRRKEQSA